MPGRSSVLGMFNPKHYWRLWKYINFSYFKTQTVNNTPHVRSKTVRSITTVQKLNFGVCRANLLNQHQRLWWWPAHLFANTRALQVHKSRHWTNCCVPVKCKCYCFSYSHFYLFILKLCSHYPLPPSITKIGDQAILCETCGFRIRLSGYSQGVMYNGKLVDCLHIRTLFLCKACKITCTTEVCLSILVLVKLSNRKFIFVLSFIRDSLKPTKRNSENHYRINTARAWHNRRVVAGTPQIKNT